MIDQMPDSNSDEANDKCEKNIELGPETQPYDNYWDWHLNDAIGSTSAPFGRLLATAPERACT